MLVDTEAGRNVASLLEQVLADFSDKAARLVLADALEELPEAQGRIERLDRLRSKFGFWSIEMRPPYSSKDSTPKEYLVWNPRPGEPFVVARVRREFKCLDPLHELGATSTTTSSGPDRRRSTSSPAHGVLAGPVPAMSDSSRAAR